jgi:hypothetical protein
MAAKVGKIVALGILTHVAAITVEWVAQSGLTDESCAEPRISLRKDGLIITIFYEDPVVHAAEGSLQSISADAAV